MPFCLPIFQQYFGAKLANFRAIKPESYVEKLRLNHLPAIVEE